MKRDPQQLADELGRLTRQIDALAEDVRDTVDRTAAHQLRTACVIVGSTRDLVLTEAVTP